MLFIDPNLLAFIKTKRSRRETLQRPNLENRSDCSRKEVVFVDHEMHQEKKAAESAGFNPYVEFSINKDLPGMDVVEAEKLEWMKDPMQYSSKQHKVSLVLCSDILFHYMLLLLLFIY